MSQIQVDTILDKAGTGAPEFPQGLTGTTATFSGNVTVGGTLTSEDKTNVDSLGIVTSRTAINVGPLAGIAATITVVGDVQTAGAGLFAGIVTASSFTGAGTGLSGNASSLSAGGLTGTPNITVAAVTAGNGANVTGIVTATSVIAGAAVTSDATGLDASGKVNLSGFLRENITITGGKLSDNTDINVNNGMVHYFTTTETTTAIPNVMSNAGINTDLSVGDVITVTVITTAAAAGFSAQWKVDGIAVTESWIGGSAPTAGGSSGLDIYAMNIIKIGDASYKVIGNLTNAAQ